MNVELEDICEEFKEFLKHSFANVRSSHRTHKMHHAIIRQLIHSYPEYEKYDWVHEWRLPKDGFGGTFDIDVVGFKDSVPKVFILAKSINSSYAKNSKNYANTSIGEMHRIMDSDIINPEQVFFINIYPRILPTFNNQGIVTGYDNVAKSKEKTNIKPIMESYYPNKVFEINIYYDIKNIYDYKTSAEFAEIIPENINGFKIENRN